MNFILTGLRFWYLILASVLLTGVGCFLMGIRYQWGIWLLLAGILILAVHFLITLTSAIRIQRTVFSDEDPMFREMMDQMMADPNEFLAGKMEEQEKKVQLHGDALRLLNDEELYDVVYEQNLRISEAAEESELDAFTGVRKTVFVLNLFDMEVQNGGLCQFFVNSSREAAPLVSQALAEVGAVEHQKLFDGFVADNKIDLADLSSFLIFSKRGYMKQTKRFDYEAFDDSYAKLPALQNFVVSYIRSNISEF